MIPQLTNDAQCAPDTMSECAAVWCQWARQVQGVERVAGLKNAKWGNGVEKRAYGWDEVRRLKLIYLLAYEWSPTSYSCIMFFGCCFFFLLECISEQCKKKNTLKIWGKVRENTSHGILNMSNTHFRSQTAGYSLNLQVWGVFMLL